MTELFFFDPERLAALSERHRGQFATAEPFPHVVIDDFLPPEWADQVAAAFPRPGDREWITHVKPTSLKLAASQDWTMPAPIRQLLTQFNTGAMIDFLEQLVGIKGLVTDPHLEGGGMHQIVTGGFLKIHADFNRHPRLNLDRRLNLLFYLNEPWEDEWGGHLELWDRSMTTCVKRIAPVLNRCVIFATTDWAYHGHPEPLACPEGVTRKSLALYYYSNGRPASEASDAHTTLYQQRPGEEIPGVRSRRVLKPVKRLLRR